MFKFILECFNDRARGKQAAMVGKRCVPHQDFLVLERRHSIADNFNGVGGYNGANSGANFIQRTAGGAGNTSEVLIDIPGSSFPFGCGTAFGWFHFFHMGDATSSRKKLPTLLPQGATKNAEI